jgi:hypothetical protein
MEEQILSKSSVVQALGNSFQADQEKLRAVTQYLTESSKMRGTFFIKNKVTLLC